MKDYKKVRIILINMLEDLEQSLEDVSKPSSLVENCDNHIEPQLPVKDEKNFNKEDES